MKINWQAIGITALAAGVLYYPAFRLYKYLTAKAGPKKTDGVQKHHVKAFVPAYRGKHKLQHKSTQNGFGGQGHS